MGCSTKKIGVKNTVLISAIIVLAGCGTSKEGAKDPGETLREYESSFHPSEYDQPLKDFFPDKQTSGGTDSSSGISRTPAQQTELTRGYRVQVFATTNYDEAVTMKANVEAQFPDEWFYLVYDAPTYKLRGGNFIERYEADRFAKLVADKGYKNAWVVPERVFKNPPPHPQTAEGAPK